MGRLEELLNEGLSAGYAGNSSVERVQRGDITVKQSRYTSPEDGGTYIDQWVNGGGQEIVRLPNGKGMTRVYAGGVIEEAVLARLGINKEQVTDELKASIRESLGKTRLHEHYWPESKGEWHYAYTVQEGVPEIPLTQAMETLHYKDTLVFAHTFSISPIQ